MPNRASRAKSSPTKASWKKSEETASSCVKRYAFHLLSASCDAAEQGDSRRIRAPQCGLVVPIKGLPTKGSIWTQDPNSLLRQLTHFSGQSVGPRRMRYSVWRSAKRIASSLSVANALRADSSESLFAMSWTDEDTGCRPALKS